MHKLRVLFAVILGILIVGGLLHRYKQNPTKQIVVDPLQPVRSIMQKLTTRLGLKSPIASDTIAADIDSPGTTGPTGSVKHTPQLHPDFITGVTTSQALIDILGEASVLGNANASLILLQRCDFDSRYCYVGYEDGELFDYIEAYPELGYQFKSYPRTKDSGVTLQHQAARCADQLADDETYISYYFSLYQAHGRLTREEIIELASRMGIEGFESCLMTQSSLPIEAEMQLGRELFDFKTLPANVLIDLPSGRRLLIPGLYETAEVLDAIAWMKKQ